MVRGILAMMVALAAGGALAADPLPVERVTTEGPGSSNSYLVDAGSDVVVVDGQRTLSLGLAVARRSAATGKPVAGILITHPHPEQVGGLRSLANATSASVYGSADTAVELGADTRKLLAANRNMSPDDTASSPPRPSPIVRDGVAFRLGDLEIVPVEFGASEAATTTMYSIPAANVLFTGDLLSPDTVPFLLEKRTAAWLAQLDEIEERFPADTMAYPGHGTPGPLGPMVAAQRAYLTTFRERVQEALADGKVTADEARAIVAATEEENPGATPAAAFPDLLMRNVVAVAAELVGDPGAPPVATFGE